MKLGFASAILPDLSFEEVYSFAAENGFRCVETMCWPKGKAERRYAGVTHIDVANLTDEEAEHYKAYAAEKGVEISAIAYYPNTLDPDLEARSTYISHIRSCIAAAKKLGLHNVNTFIGRDQSKSVSANMTEFKRVWPDIIKFAEDNDVRIGIENCPMLFTEDEWPGGKNLAISPKIWREMFSVIDSKYFGLNLDPSHMYWMQMDYIKPIYEFRDRIFHVHLKDIKLYKDRLDDVGTLASPLEYMAPKIPGLGDIDWGAYISALYDIGYDGSVVLEIEDKAFENSLEDRKYSILQAKKHVEQFLF